ncbi:MAG: serine/threonine-protein kinase [Cyanobacteria bacterium P01_E01_bin.6]
MDSNCLGGRYKIIGQLGAGGFSRTFLVQDLHLPNNPRCVIKQLKPQTMEPKSLEMARRLFDTEARVLYQLGKHEQIPTLLAHFEEGQEFYLAQEYIEGIQLSWEISNRAPLSETRTILLLREILNILVFVHHKQVIHRDVKPSNLIRRYRDGKIVLIDFGAVKEVSKQKINPECDFTGLTVAVGTQGYMPNEQLAGRPRFSSDVYAVGIIGVRALTSIHPKHFKDDFQTGELDWHQHIKSASPELISAIDCMVKYDFRDRFPSAIEALKALQDIPVDPDEAAQPELDLMFRNPISQDVSTHASEQFVLSLPEGYPPPLTAQETTTSLAESNVEYGEEFSYSSPSYYEARSAQVSRRLLKVLGYGGLFIGSIGAVLALINSDRASMFYERYINQQLLILQSPVLQEMTSAARAILPAKLLAQEALIEAQQLQQDGNYESALSLYEKAIGFQADLAEAYLGQCEILNELGKPTDAIVACNDALAYRPGYPEAIRSKGNALEQQGILLEALRRYERATLFDPELFAAWLDQGRILQKVGRSAEAIPVLERAIALERDSVEAWTLLGDALWRLERYTKSIEALDKALQINPEYPEAVRLRQRARDVLGR